MVGELQLFRFDLIFRQISFVFILYMATDGLTILIATTFEFTKGMFGKILPKFEYSKI